MQNELTILAAGGDLRYDTAARALAEVAAVFTIALPTGTPCPEGLRADLLLLPCPVSADGVHLLAPQSEKRWPLAALLSRLKPGAPVLGGLFGETAALFKAAGHPVADYTRDERFALRNALPTAEGAVAILLDRLPRTLDGASVLVTGYGRIGRVLAAKLTALGADVTVAARKPTDRVKAELAGCRAVPFEALPTVASGFDAVCSTVPAKVVTADVLAALPAEAPVVDLASAPGSVDEEAARVLGRTVIPARGLPGKCAPVTAGRILAETVREIIDHEGGDGVWI